MNPGDAQWWAIRRAQNLSASVYTCPFCDGRLPALAEHMLIAPEGDAGRRRHAHTECVLEARKRGTLPTWDEWSAGRPRDAPWWRRVLRLAGRSGG